jgi:phosphoribosyl 1,2-cyclic phosphate phosphodiesterase
MGDGERMLTVTVLGSGTSHGVPMIGCQCRVCTSTDPRDSRTRPSIVLGIDGHNVLIDTSPELRLQLINAGIDQIEEVLYTHGHADHVHGIDDLRRFNESLHGPVPVYAAAELLRDIQVRFHYIFSHQLVGGGIPSFDLRPIDGPITLHGRTVTPIPVWHGDTPVFGYRVDGFAYVTDTNFVPESSQALLRDLDVLMIDALRREPHPTHFSFAEALGMVTILRPKRTYFTHLTHTTLHAEVEPELPDNVFLAYDGLRLEFP